jgi:hypothetical protein
MINNHAKTMPKVIEYVLAAHPGPELCYGCWHINIAEFDPKYMPT